MDLPQDPGVLVLQRLALLAVLVLPFCAVPPGWGGFTWGPAHCAVSLALQLCDGPTGCAQSTTAKNMNAPLPSTTHDQESVNTFVQDDFSSWLLIQV